jgi:hypothetical protein
LRKVAQPLAELSTVAIIWTIRRYLRNNIKIEIGTCAAGVPEIERVGKKRKEGLRLANYGVLFTLIPIFRNMPRYPCAAGKNFGYIA